MKYFISDLHFFHNSLNVQMDCRGFADAETMNSYMISQWNSRVKPNDEVYILGDLSIAKWELTKKIVDQLHGKLFLIEGNHDERFLRDKDFEADRFEWIKPYAEIYDHKRKVILCHYPVFCYNGQYQRRRNGSARTYMLYGHVHSTMDEDLVQQFQEITRNTMRVQKQGGEPAPIPCHMINCFCMFSNYIPLTLDEWIAKDAARNAAGEN